MFFQREVSATAADSLWQGESDMRIHRRQISCPAARNVFRLRPASELFARKGRIQNSRCRLVTHQRQTTLLTIAVCASSLRNLNKISPIQTDEVIAVQYCFVDQRSLSLDWSLKLSFQVQFLCCSLITCSSMFACPIILWG